MQVLYVGNFRPAHSTENHIAYTLEDLGHEVFRVQEDELSQDSLLRDLEACEAELFLWTRTWNGHVTKAILDRVKQTGIKTVSYHLDLYVPIARVKDMPGDPFWQTDYVFTPDGSPQAAVYFGQHNIRHYYLKPGVYKAECVRGTERRDLLADVAFIGNTQDYHPEWPYRRQLADWLKAEFGAWVRFYGKPYRTVRNQELNDVLASTKIIIGDTLCPGFTYPNYWSDRVYETTGRGGFIIHPRITGLEEEFVENKEIAFYNYGDWDHLRELINWYLEHEDYREDVRTAGMQRTIAEHTYNNRMIEMLGVISGRDR